MCVRHIHHRGIKNGQALLAVSHNVTARETNDGTIVIRFIRQSPATTFDLYRVSVTDIP